MLDEWDWTEHFAPQAETLRYIQFLVAKFDLRRDMQFDTPIRHAHYCAGSPSSSSSSSSWLLTDAAGRTYSCRFLVTAMGILNEPTLPDIPGIDTYQGRVWHTARWPHDDKDNKDEGTEGRRLLAGKRVGIIGTGATGIQTIQAIYRDVAHLTVFQRTPNWTAPLRNDKIGPDEMAALRAAYPTIFAQCRASSAGFLHQAAATTDPSQPSSVLAMSEAERTAHWESLYARRGFSKVLSVSSDIFVDREANRLYSAFHAAKVRQRVHDPVVADRLIPTCHGFATRRVPLESGYYEAFNEPHVALVDVRQDPLATFTPAGLQTASGREYPLDVVICATGFDAVTGSFRAVDIRGVDGVQLTEDAWKDGIETFLGLTVPRFPNMFMIMGPHQMFGNIPRSIEYAVDWTADLLAWARTRGIRHVEATPAGARAWTEHVWQCGQGLLANEVDSWMTGVNRNLAHKQARSLTRYQGPAPGYRRRCDEVKAREYADFILR